MHHVKRVKIIVLFSIFFIKIIFTLYGFILKCLIKIKDLFIRFFQMRSKRSDTDVSIPLSTRTTKDLVFELESDELDSRGRGSF